MLIRWEKTALIDLKIYLTTGHPFGNEVQINDNDQSNVLENIARW